MIKSIHIKNIQRHENTKIEFVSGMNTIKGPSHAGKSTIIKAFTTAIDNNPPIKSIRTTLFKPKSNISSSKIEFDDGNIERKLDKNLLYFANGEKLEATKRGEVPEEISKVTRMSEINIQTQFNKFFMLQDSPGVRAKKFNEAANLTIIDEKVKKANSIVNNAEKDLKNCNTGIKEKEEEIIGYDYLDDAGDLIENIQEMLDQNKENAEKSHQLQKSVNAIKSIEDDITQIQDFLKVEPKLKQIKELVSKRNDLDAKLIKVESIKNTIIDINKEIEEDSEFLACESSINSIKKLMEKRTETQNKLVSLSNACNHIHELEKVNSALQEKHIQFEKDLSKLQKQYDRESEICPECGAYRRHWRK